MIVYESRIAHRRRCMMQIAWWYVLCMVLFAAFLMGVSGDSFADIAPFFVGWLMMALIGFLRVNHIRYKVCDSHLHCNDFRYRQIDLKQVRKVVVWKRIQWFTFDIPYTLQIEGDGFQKLRLMPEKQDELIALMQAENNEIEWVEKH